MNVQMRSKTSAPASEAGEVVHATGPGWASFRNIGAVYVWILLVALFSVWAPETFPTYATVRQILNQEAITALVALSLMLPLAAGLFDLSIGFTLGVCNVLCASLIVRSDVPVLPAILLTILAALLIGVINAAVVVLFKIDSFIGTLATGSLMLAAINMISGNTQIVGSQLSTGFFYKIANSGIAGITFPVVYMLLVAIALWIVLEFTVAGRWFYSIGYNQEAARLAGIPVARMRFIALVVCSAISGAIAGVAVTSQIASGSTTVGSPYLLNAFAAAFLGATQLRQGRFNPWGTLIAVFMLGTGTVGLGLAGTPSWAPSVFTGLVLLLALGITRAEQSK